MFDLFRNRQKNTRILLGILLGLVALSMLIYLAVPGALSTNGGATDATTVATVGGAKITTTDVQRAIAQVTRGQNLPKGLMAMYLPSMIDQLVASKAMAYQAKQMGLTVSDQDIADSLQAAFTAQNGGKFDPDRYKEFLSNVEQQNGLTAEQILDGERDDRLAAQLDALERKSIVVSDADARAEYQRKNVKVALQYIPFEAKDFVSKVNHDPAAIKAYFDKNRNDFKIPEKRDVTMIVGSTATFLQNAKVSDAELRKEYQDSIDSFRTPERVRIRHILIKTQGKPKEEAPQLKAKAEDLLKQLKGGADFAELAKKNSEDPGSAAKGGELDWVTRGQMVPNFEKAAFSLKPGELSGVVETEYGYHILQCEDRQDAHTQTFEEARPQLFAEAQKQQATDALSRAMDSARDQVAKNPAKAQDIAAGLGLAVSKLDGISAGAISPDIIDPQLSSQIFSTAKGGVTDIVNVEKQGKSAFAIINNITPTRNGEFNEVQANVLTRYDATESARLAADAAKAAAERAHKGESLEAIAKEYGLTVKTAAPFTVDGSVEGIGAGSQLSAAFSANPGDVVGPIAGSSGQFVCRVTDKMPADMNLYAQSKAGIIDSLTQQRLQIQSPLFRDSIVAELKKRGKIKMNDAVINRMIENLQG